MANRRAELTPEIRRDIVRRYVENPNVSAIGREVALHASAVQRILDAPQALGEVSRVVRARTRVRALKAHGVLDLLVTQLADRITNGDFDHKGERRPMSGKDLALVTGILSNQVDHWLTQANASDEMEIGPESLSQQERRLTELLRETRAQLASRAPELSHDSQVDADDGAEGDWESVGTGVSSQQGGGIVADEMDAGGQSEGGCISVRRGLTTDRSDGPAEGGSHGQPPTPCAAEGKLAFFSDAPETPSTAAPPQPIGDLADWQPGELPQPDCNPDNPPPTPELDDSTPEAPQALINDPLPWIGAAQRGGDPEDGAA